MLLIGHLVPLNISQYYRVKFVVEYIRNMIMAKYISGKFKLQLHNEENTS